MITGLIKMIT